MCYNNHCFPVSQKPSEVSSKTRQIKNIIRLNLKPEAVFDQSSFRTCFKNDPQKAGDEVIFYVFCQPGHIFGTRSSPGRSRDTFKSICMILTRFGASCGSFFCNENNTKSRKRNVRGASPRNIMCEQQTTTPTTTKQVDARTCVNTTIEPKRGGGVRQSPLETTHIYTSQNACRSMFIAKWI